MEKEHDIAFQIDFVELEDIWHRILTLHNQTMMVFILLQVFIPLLRHIPQVALILLVEELYLILPVLLRQSFQAVLQRHVLLLKSSLQVGIMYNEDQSQDPLVYELLHAFLQVLHPLLVRGRIAGGSHQRDQHLYHVLELFELLGGWVLLIAVEQFEAVAVEDLEEVIDFGDLSEEVLLFCQIFEDFQLRKVRKRRRRGITIDI